MNNGIYNAASGLTAARQRLDIISHNLANVSTSGYRAQRPFSRVLEGLAPSAAGPFEAASSGVALAGTYEVPGRGLLQATGGDLDVALPDGTFLTVQTAAGRRYTRAGDLRLSGDGYLTDSSRNRILDPKGKPITGLRATARIAGDGRVLDGEQGLGRLGLVQDPLGVLRRDGSGLLSAAGNDRQLEPAKEPQLLPGWLEGSGTDALRELVSLIEAQRSFESLQKIISLTMYDVDRKAVNDLAG